MQEIVDSHFHIWRREDQPWLMGPMVAAHLRAVRGIRRDYPMEEYLADRAHRG